MVALILTALMLSSCNQMEQETTVYWASCKGEMKGQACNGVIISEARMSFKVLVSRQEVLFWFDDSGMVDKLNSCVVRDKDSWNCSYGKQMWIMDNGNFRKYPPETNEKWFVISKYRRWPAYISEWYRNILVRK